MKERQLTIRLEEQLALELDRLSSRSGLTRAAIVRAALKEYFQGQRQKEGDRPVDLVRDLLGGASLAADTRGEMIERIRRQNVRPT